MTHSIWEYQQSTGHRPGVDLTGFEVEAIDGKVGKVDKHSEEFGASFLVVDAGPWILGKRVLLPAGVISSIDHENSIVFVARTKEEIKDAPELEKEINIEDDEYHRQLASYYGAPHT
ncbi:PRC-barrel domain containing protein [Streptomyces piniterrae]|uniref:PRC-barrel domain containing protein n=1 Tax=Streptomyces piniterrae TaxID=2571125 RepID=A0A4U0NS12_9ACTN|nr:PRC-barrel domain containing protein [Streptomyces piniterrae]TJZ56792.1 PRC-barrel domain containing protein [Streptomyces piniterrae]